MSEVINRNDVRMPKIGLDFDLPSDLVLHLLIKSFFLDDLEAANEVSGHVLHEIHLPIAALVDESNDFEDLLLTVQSQYFEGLFLAF